MREYPLFIVPHSQHGDSNCCGLIYAVERDGEADLTCNECGNVIKTVSSKDADRTLAEMAASSITNKCPVCGESNRIQGFDEVLAFRCRRCGASIQIDDEEEQIVFAPGSEPNVDTMISVHCATDNCADCPGFLTDEDTGKPVFCVHHCHRVQ